MASTKVTKKSKKPTPPRKAAVAKKTRKTEEWLDKELKDIVQEEKEEVVEDDEEIDIKDLPVIPLSVDTRSELSKIYSADQPDAQDKSAAVYLGHIPYGFEEFQMQSFFSQFGEVQRSFISRSPKTGRPRGFGFVEFLHPEIAQIVADTMNDYLLYKKRLVCRVLPLGSALRVRWRTGPIPERTPFTAQRRAAQHYNQQNKKKSASHLISFEKKKKQKLASVGIDYHFDGYATLISQLNSEQEKKDDGEAEKKDDGGTEKRKRDAEEAELWKKRKQTKLATEETALQKKAKKQKSKQKALKSKNALKSKKALKSKEKRKRNSSQ